MLGLLFSMLLHPYTLIGLGVLVAIGAAIYFLAGPVRFVAIFADIRTWFAIAAVLAVLAYANVLQQNQDMKASIEAAKVQTVQNQKTSDQDAKTVTQTRVVQKAKRATQSTRLQEKIDHAQPGQAEDDVLDGIAEDQPHAASSAPAHGVRKRPDGIVVP